MQQVTGKDHITELSLIHPERGNGLGLDEAKFLIKVLKDKKIEGLILTAQGDRLFCAGGNLQEQAKLLNPRKTLAVQKKIRAALSNLSLVGYPTVAVVEGDVFGGGLELVSSFDRVIATPQVVFSFWQRKLGLSFGWGGGKRMLGRISAKKLRQLLLEARLISAYEAKDLGIIDEISPAHQIRDRARQWIKEQKKLPSFPQLKNWTPEKESVIFDSLWMNGTQKNLLNKYRG